MTQTYKKKLIEVAIPLEAINAASAREKSIRHGHPSTLHLWWARRPLAACRAVLFAQLVDDPSSRVDELMSDPKLRAKAEAELPARVVAWEKSKASAQGAAANAPAPALEDVVVEIERKRLFAIIEELVKWENSTNEEVLERARAEIRRSCGDELPPVYDPFSGGGSIPLEAQRLGLPAYGSDLNPVAVMIGKAMIEIPPKFKDMLPIHPGIKERSFYRNVEGLAEDLKYYGKWMREKAWERIGHLYPQVDLPKEYGGGKATVIAWVWSRTVPSPDPAFADVHVPIASSFLLGSKAGKEAWIEPIVDRAGKAIQYVIRRGGTKAQLAKARGGTKSARANFRCLLSGGAITADYVREKAQAGEMGEVLIAVVAEGKNGRFYVAPDADQISAAKVADFREAAKDFRETNLLGATPERLTGGTCHAFGLENWGKLFTDRQVISLKTLTGVLPEAKERAFADAVASGRKDDSVPLARDGQGASAYADAICVYLAFAINRSADRGSTICSWDSSPKMEALRNTFARQALPMTWDFAEGNPFSDATGNFLANVEWVYKVVERFVPSNTGREVQFDAQSVEIPKHSVISTDPPYYDNIGYADLSDFFFCWMRVSLKPFFPDLFGVLATPKAEELVATAFRHGGRQSAEAFFLDGMGRAIKNMARQSSDLAPATIYYAFKQSEVAQEGVSSTGWATFLQATVEAGYAVVGTWPMRTEMANRMVASGTNALANSVVLVCRKKEATAAVITRAEFIRALTTVRLTAPALLPSA